MCVPSLTRHNILHFVDCPVPSKIMWHGSVHRSVPALAYFPNSKHAPTIYNHQVQSLVIALYLPTRNLTSIVPECSLAPLVKGSPGHAPILRTPPASALVICPSRPYFIPGRPHRAAPTNSSAACALSSVQSVSVVTTATRAPGNVVSCTARVHHGEVNCSDQPAHKKHQQVRRH